MHAFLLTLVAAIWLAVASAEIQDPQTALDCLEQLPPQQTLRYLPTAKNAGTEGIHAIWVITSLDCEYCREFHRRIPTLQKAGVEVRVVAFPQSGYGSYEFGRWMAIFCDAHDPLAALDRAMSEETLLPPPTQCRNPMAQHLHLAQCLGIQGTPTIVYPSGEMVPGAASPKQVLRHLHLTTPQLK